MGIGAQILLKQAISMLILEKIYEPLVQYYFEKFSLLRETIEKVKQFYIHDSNSKIMTDKKDIIFVKSDGSKYIEQKRLVLYNLRELHAMYKEENKDHPDFSKFCQLRP